MNHPDVTIRRARASDVGAIVHLIGRATKNGKILKRSRNEIKKALPFFFVADDDGLVVGCCSVEVYNRKLAEIRSLAVARDRQRTGIASALVGTCVKDAARRGVYEVLAITDRLNLFKKRGFSEQLHGQKALFLRP